MLLITFKGSSVVTQILQEVREAALHFSQCILLNRCCKSLLKQRSENEVGSHNLASLPARPLPATSRHFKGPSPSILGIIFASLIKLYIN